jgi:hypothetical protein
LGEVETPRPSTLFAAAAEEDELMDLMIVNQTRNIREKEPPSGSSLGHY